MAFGSAVKRPELFEMPDHPGEMLYDIENGLKITRAQLPMKVKLRPANSHLTASYTRLTNQIC